MGSHLQVEELTKSFGDLVLFENISFGLAEGERVGLIAPNGSGKSTLLNIIAGKEGYDAGNIVFRRDLRVGYLEQTPRFPDDITVAEACFHSDNETVRTIAAYEKALSSEKTDELPALMEKMDRLKAWDYEHRAKQILTRLNITDFNQKTGHLSGGQLKRIALANVLIAEPELLILDEPTNHLDLEMTEWLEDYLKRSRISLLMVTHDRYFLDRVCNSILEIDLRSLYLYKGNYSYYLEKRQERLNAENSEVARAANLMRKELDWMRRQPQARAGKAKYRIDAFHKLEEKARSARNRNQVELNVQASYIGSKIFEARHLNKSFGPLCILNDFNYVFARYEKLGIAGNNGTGKSTFIKMLMKQVDPDSGEIEIGETVRFGYYSQDGLQFDEQMKVIDAVREISEEISLGDGKKLSASQFLQYFLFSPETQHNYIYKLSGGEKRRLYLCRVLIGNPNFLVLDEPTNDLDIMTLNVLEEYLRSFKGCVIVVSHDRYFMDKVVDHLLVFKGNGILKDFPGNYTDYREWKMQQEETEKALQTAEKKHAQPAKSANIPATPQTAGKRKLTFKEKKEWETLEQEIPALEQEKTALETSLSSGLLTNEKLIEQSERIAEVIRLIDEKSMRWLELSELL